MFLQGFKVLQDTALPDTGLNGTPVEQGGRTWPEQDIDEIDRLYSRAELEMSNPEVVRRRETIAQLKLVAASTRQEASSLL